MRRIGPNPAQVGSFRNRMVSCYSNGMPTLNSSCISRAEYEFGTLYLTFNSGSTYTLRGVPEYHYIGLLRASSAGSYFNRYLKGRY